MAALGSRENDLMLPLALLKTAKNQPMMVELKNGETYSGVLAAIDKYMNLHMRDIVCTSKDGERFWKIPECFIRGNNVKYLRIPDEVFGMAQNEPMKDSKPIAKGRGKGKGAGKGAKK
eukprot:GEMP01076214.1.p1 GENE.GEMP01076214.1~~GEMP01076214.1.p1  ORF type:complete len:118 (+),score=23.57 GEMP01076214.1:39-392(+)